MEQELKITSVLADPTRYYIYQYIAQKHNQVTVQEIADEFNIHPNVARLHLTRLEDVNMIISETQKTGRGGRPSRLYYLSDNVIQLQFPFRDYKLLSQITLNTLLSLGEIGQKALLETGRQFGTDLMLRHLSQLGIPKEEISQEDKIGLAREAMATAGLSPQFELSKDETKVFYQIYNCPFKELAAENPQAICNMHSAMMQGILHTLFPSSELVHTHSMLTDCNSCNYKVHMN